MLLRCVLRTVLWILFVILLSVVVIMANPGPISGKVPYKMTVKATAYTIHDPGMNGRGLTSRGGYARPWYTVAVIRVSFPWAPGSTYRPWPPLPRAAGL